METVTAYKPCCCSKAMLSKASVMRHERKCLKNPSNQACPTCEFLHKESVTHYHFMEPPEYDVLAFYCTVDEESPEELGEDWDPKFKRDCENWKRKEGAK